MMNNVKKLIYKDLKLLVHPATIMYFFTSVVLGLNPECPRFASQFICCLGLV